MNNGEESDGGGEAHRKKIESNEMVVSPLCKVRNVLKRNAKRIYWAI